MKRKDGHQSKTVGEQVIKLNRPSSSLNDKTRSEVKDFPGYFSQARSSPSENFVALRKQGAFWEKPSRQEWRKISIHRQKRRPPRILGEKKTSASRAEISSERKSSKESLITLEPLSVTLETLSLKRTLKGGSLKLMSISGMSENPLKANIQGVKTCLVNINKNGKKTTVPVLVVYKWEEHLPCWLTPRRAALTSEGGNSDRPSDASNVDRNMYEQMTPYKPWIGF